VEAVLKHPIRVSRPLMAHGAREDQVAKDGTTLNKMMADAAAEILKNLPRDVDAFVRRHQAR
jgi:hypothetical protein